MRRPPLVRGVEYSRQKARHERLNNSIVQLPQQWICFQKKLPIFNRTTLQGLLLHLCWNILLPFLKSVLAFLLKWLIPSQMEVNHQKRFKRTQENVKVCWREDGRAYTVRVQNMLTFAPSARRRPSGLRREALCKSQFHFHSLRLWFFN